MNSANPTIHVFGKPDCDFCTRAKNLLQEEGLDYIEHDISQSDALAAASSYYSGSVKVPQIFIGSQHINGAEDLEALQHSGLLESFIANASGELVLDPDIEAQWVAGAEDFKLANVLEKTDPTEDLDDPENVLILSFYKPIFGFSAVTYDYMAAWPEAYKSCALSNVIANFAQVMTRCGPYALANYIYTASNAQECTYCAVHTGVTGALGTEEQPKAIKALRAAREGNPGPDNPYTALDVALSELVEQATLNKVTDDQINKITELANEASQDPLQAIEFAALGGQMMALFNIFNDLVNVDIEGDLAVIADKELGIEGGRHAAMESNPDNLVNLELPEPELTIETALAARREKAGNWENTARQALGYIPGWLNDWPEEMRPVYTALYTELMSEVQVSAELKHLVARTSAIAKGHEALAASAAVSAHHAAKDKDRAIARIKQCFAAATDQLGSDLFSPAEKLALRLAWLSAQTPIVTPAQFVKPLTDHFSNHQLIELIVACGMSASAQRMAAAMQAQIGAEEAAFCRENGIETNILLLKYPTINA